MAMNSTGGAPPAPAPTLTAPAPAPTLTAPAPTPVAPPAVTPAPAATAPAQPSVPTPAILPPKPQTLQDVLAARKLALNPEAYRAANAAQTPTAQGGTPTQAAGTSPDAAPQTPAPTGEAPQNTPGELTPEQAMFQLYKQDPATLMRVLEAATGKPAGTPLPAQAPQYLPPVDFQRQQAEAAQAQYAERPTINLQGLLGAEALQELGVANTDFTATMEQFVHATMAPIFAQLLSDMYAANHGIHTQLQQFQPVLQSHKQTDLQRELGKQLHQAFPALATGDANARSYAEKRFNELAPVLMSKELMEQPHTNPEEYARITTGIAKIAAGEYANLTPAPNPPAQSQIPPATVPPEPQPITPVYRNHIGQFAARQAPRTLEEWNAQRLAQLSLRQ